MKVTPLDLNCPYLIVRDKGPHYSPSAVGIAADPSGHFPQSEEKFWFKNFMYLEGSRHGEYREPAWWDPNTVDHLVRLSWDQYKCIRRILRAQV